MKVEDGKKVRVCKKCGAIRKNKAAKDDNMDIIIKLSANGEICD